MFHHAAKKGERKHLRPAFSLSTSNFDDLSKGDKRGLEEGGGQNMKSTPISPHTFGRERGGETPCREQEEVVCNAGGGGHCVEAADKMYREKSVFFFFLARDQICFPPLCAAPPVQYRRNPPMRKKEISKTLSSTFPFA